MDAVICYNIIRSSTFCGSDYLRKILFAVTAAVMLMLTACSSVSDVSEETGSVPLPEETASEAAEDISSEPVIPFAEHTLELRGTAENYMIIIRRGEYDDEISVTVENNRYESREFVITSPAGYDILFPYEQKHASEIVRVIKNDIDDKYFPDIMQFSFSISQEELENDPDNTAYSVSRMYTVDDDGELREIRIVSYPQDDDDDITVYDYLDRTQLYHTEPGKFIVEMSVDDNRIYDDDGDLRPAEQRVRIKTMTFDPKNLEFILGYEDISEDNPLYFGYAYWAAANLAAQYFTMNTFNVSDYVNYVEVSDVFSDSSAYYFRIDDPRFSDTDDLMTYLETVFSETTAQRIFHDAPQKYRDIDGEIYGIVGDGGYDFSLGTLTFSGMEITENRMLFRSRQEKYNEDGVFTGYTDGGNFVIAKQDDGYWKVIQYRFPYSFN